MVEPTYTLYITIRVTGKSYSQTIQQGISHIHQCSATRGTSTCAQPQERPTQQIYISLSPQENHLEYHLKPDSTESTRQETTRHNNSVQSLTHTHHMGIFTPHRGTHHFILVHRGMTYPYHGHTQHMGSLTGRITQSVSWRMSHEVVIINTLCSYNPNPKLKIDN